MFLLLDVTLSGAVSSQIPNECLITPGSVCLFVIRSPADPQLQLRNYRTVSQTPRLERFYLLRQLYNQLMARNGFSKIHFSGIRSSNVGVRGV